MSQSALIYRSRLTKLQFSFLIQTISFLFKQMSRSFACEAPLDADHIGASKTDPETQSLRL